MMIPSVSPPALAFMFLLILLVLPASGVFWRKSKSNHPCAHERHKCKWKWTTCSKPCDGGHQIPVVTKREGKCGKCILPKTRACNMRCCPDECQWHPWKKHGPCSVSCGGGHQEIRRKIVYKRQCGKKPCTGSTVSLRSCNTKPCPS